MKRFATTYSNGHNEQTSSVHEANGFVNYDDAQLFFLSGKQVSAIEFFACVRDGVQFAWDKKSETHKRARVLHGSSAACFVEQWVKR